MKWCTKRKQALLNPYQLGLLLLATSNLIHTFFLQKSMDQTLPDTLVNLKSSPIFYLLPIIFILLFNYIISPFRKRPSLPPGPTPWPLIGNILHLQKKMHISMANLAKSYGPLISLKLGTQVVTVASSPPAAAEILKNQDRLLSARFVRKAVPCGIDVLERISLVWNPTCSDQWKFLRTLSRTELFSAKAIESQASLREKKLMEMIELLKSKQGEVVNIGEIVFAAVFNTLSNLLFSKDLIGLEDEGKATGVKGTVWKLMEMATSPNIAEFYPILEVLDLQGLKRKASSCIKELFGVWEIYIKERRERPPQNTDFLDVFLANGFDDDQINWLAMFLNAGTDTTTTTIEWAMAELVKNKQTMEKLEEELEREIDNKTINESQVSQLPYLNACIKETLRLHPPVPFLLPRRALETCEIMNYTIPKDAQLLVNFWAIATDSSTWEDPLSFKPERFLTTVVDFKGHDFGLIPFGSGRRICSGLPMAARQLPLILGYLIRCFHWSLLNGENLNNLDMSEKFGITLQKEQLLHVIPTRKF
ncbi:probable (S)-N-methylcoclaurine 3'-hydroxylase isozyme 2 [Euphorbia lathyris]|uniref:probable (S)-N-methylcoclaurine 3'-hydroxylase isozyme 2 n=1 Tax=Euphorbia lathyris TaxID=212925 RepID=UPI00331310AA